MHIDDSSYPITQDGFDILTKKILPSTTLSQIIEKKNKWMTKNSVSSSTLVVNLKIYT